MGLRLLLGKELLEQRRTYRLLVVGLLFAFVGISSPLLARYTPELIKAFAPDAAASIALPAPTTSDAVNQLLKNLAQFGGLAAILLAMGSVATEKERGTAALLLANPVSRTAFLAAKLVALATILAIGTAIAAICAWVYTAILFAPPALGPFVAMAILVWLSLVAYAAVTFVASVVTRSALAAGGIGFVALLVLGIVSAFPSLDRFVPPGLATAAGNLVLGRSADVLVPLLSTLVLIAAAVAVAWGSFRHQEL